MTDKERLMREIDEGPWPAMMAWADLEEELGNHLVSTGLRWLIKRRRFPADRGQWWRWSEASPHRFQQWEDNAYLRDNFVLPRDVLWHMKDWAPYWAGERDWERTASLALEEAARSVGNFLFGYYPLADNKWVKESQSLQILRPNG